MIKKITKINILAIFLSICFFTVNQVFAATMYLSIPEGQGTGSNEFYQGRCARADIMINTEGEDSGGADAYITYDSNYIQIVQSNCDDVAEVPYYGTIFDAYPSGDGNKVTSSQIIMGGYENAGNSFNGTGRMGYFYFKVLNPGSTILDFDFTLGSTTDSNIAQLGTGNDILTTATDYTLSLAQDDDTPTISNRDPSSGDTNVRVNHDINFRLNDDDAGIDIYNTTVTLDSINYTESGTNTFADSCTDTNANRRPYCNVVVDPDLNLKYDTEYEVEVDTQDLGDPTVHSATFTYKFITEKDEDAPQIYNQVPSSNQTNVSTNSNITFRLKDIHDDNGYPGTGVDISSIKVTVTAPGWGTKEYTVASPELSYDDLADNDYGDPYKYSVSINPETDFPQNVEVSVRVQVDDEAGDTNSLDTTYYFTTTDVSGPVCNQFDPQQSWTSVLLDDSVSFHCTDAETGVNIDSLKVQLNGISYTKSGTNTFTYAGDSSDYLITVNPSTDFLTQYAFEVVIDVWDNNNNYARYAYGLATSGECREASTSTGSAVSEDDSDGDGLTDPQEEDAGTDPNDPDSDDDGDTDYEEVIIYRTNPNDPDDNSGGENQGDDDDDDSSGGTLDDCTDSDGDGLTDDQEDDAGSDPNKADSDGDGFSDYQEIFIYHTDPNDPSNIVDYSLCPNWDELSENLDYKFIVKINDKEISEPTYVIDVVRDKIHIYGKALPGSTVTILVESDPIKLTTQADENGEWFIDASGQIPAGNHKIYGIVESNSGEISDKRHWATIRITSTEGVVGTIEKTSKQIADTVTKNVAPVSTAVASTLTPIALFSILASQFGSSLTLGSFLRVFQAIGLIPAGEPQGMVYDSESFRGVPFAVVVITNAGQSNSQVPVYETIVTNSQGVYYGVNLPPGKYQFFVKHQDYTFPSKKQQPPYMTSRDFYKGGVINVSVSTKKEFVLIPVDPVGSNSNISLKAKIGFLLRNAARRSSLLFYPLFIFSIVMVVITPSFWNVVFLLLYCFVGLMKLKPFLIKPNIRGRVVDQLGNPVVNAIVRLLDNNGGKLVAIVNTDKDGKFKLNCAKAVYSITAIKEGYGASSQQSMSLQQVDTRNEKQTVVIRLQKIS